MVSAVEGSTFDVQTTIESSFGIIKVAGDSFILCHLSEGCHERQI